MENSKTEFPKEKRVNNRDRRTIVQTLMGGAGLAAASQAWPVSWIKPVISTAVIPAHAQASNVCSLFDISTLTNDTAEITAVLQLQTFGAPDGVEYSINFSSSNNEIASVSGFDPGQINNEANEGLGSGDSNLEGTIGFELELDTNPTDLEVELVFEGSSGLSNCTTETIVGGNF